jgi:hypothetical protein
MSMSENQEHLSYQIPDTFISSLQMLQTTDLSKKVNHANITLPKARLIVHNKK